MALGIKMAYEEAHFTTSLNLGKSLEIVVIEFARRQNKGYWTNEKPTNFKGNYRLKKSGGQYHKTFFFHHSFSNTIGCSVCP
jgi:hypothetical protein